MTDNAKALRDAIVAIRDYPANGNSEPDVMAQGLWDVTVLAGMVVSMLDGKTPAAEVADFAAAVSQKGN